MGENGQLSGQFGSTSTCHGPAQAPRQNISALPCQMSICKFAFCPSPSFLPSHMRANCRHPLTQSHTLSTDCCAADAASPRGRPLNIRPAASKAAPANLLRELAKLTLATAAARACGRGGTDVNGRKARKLGRRPPRRQVRIGRATVFGRRCLSSSRTTLQCSRVHASPARVQGYGKQFLNGGNTQARDPGSCSAGRARQARLKGTLGGPQRSGHRRRVQAGRAQLSRGAYCTAAPRSREGADGKRCRR